MIAVCVNPLIFPTVTIVAPAFAGATKDRTAGGKDGNFSCHRRAKRKAAMKIF
jgi:hypothetical protein